MIAINDADADAFAAAYVAMPTSDDAEQLSPHLSAAQRHAAAAIFTPGDMPPPPFRRRLPADDDYFRRYSLYRRDADYLRRCDYRHCFSRLMLI
jgi:hypothetical protein